MNLPELPQGFLTRMRALLGDDYPAFLAAYAQPPARALHVNLHKITLQGLLSAADFPIAPLDGLREGFSFDCERIGNHPLHHAGAFYVQEPSAMLPLSLIDPGMLQRSPKILDVCAAPGGKSSQAANLFAGQDGFLVANEIIPKRCQILAGNIERLGIRNAMVTNLPAGTLAELFPEVFNLTVVDAPCSGEGMFRKNPEAITEWNPDAPPRCAERQREILWAAAKTVAAGGYLLYSTCTFSTEENEGIAAAFLTDHPDFAPVTPPDAVCAITAPGIAPNGSEMPFCRRFYPHLSYGEGQFAVLFRKIGEDTPDTPDFGFHSAEIAPSKAEIAAIRAFLAETVGEIGQNLKLIARKDGIYAVRPDFPIPPVGVFSPGVKIGAVQKGRVIPDHRFFMAYGRDFAHRLELDAPSAAAYLRGSTLPCADFNGWGTATFAGCALGGIKVSNGVAKNHYPKGLRIMG